MDMRIFKYPFDIRDEVRLELPVQAEILKVDVQYELSSSPRPCLWAKIDADAPTEQVTLQIRGTGHALRSGCDIHVGTFQMHDGRLVWHVFKTV